MSANIVEYKDTDVLNLDLKTEDKLEIAKSVATPLAQLIEDKQLYTLIGQSKHVNIEGWNTLGTMLGLAPITVENKPLSPDEFARNTTRKADKIIAYESIVKIVTKDGQVLAQTSAICTNLEAGKEKNDHYAIRSMAETRATGKAYRMALSWIMQLAGYEVTPSSEMDTVNKRTNDVGSNNQKEPANIQEAEYTEKTTSESVVDSSDLQTPEQVYKRAVDRVKAKNFQINSKNVKFQAANLIRESGCDVAEDFMAEVMKLAELQYKE